MPKAYWELHWRSHSCRRIVCIPFVRLLTPNPDHGGAGSALQLFGLCTTALGMQQTRKQFGHSSIFEVFAKWYKSWPTGERKIVVGSGVR